MAHASGMDHDPITDATALTSRARAWAASNTFTAAPAHTTSLSVSVVIPALDEAGTIGPLCDVAVGHPLVDELVVVDGGSADATMSVAAEHGARAIAASDVLPDRDGPGGKGDALWRSLAATEGDIVCWIDGDLREVDDNLITMLVAPLLADPDLRFVKAASRRPLGDDDDGGGRVTELLARPLLALTFPELTGFVQPLAGEYAGRRDALEAIPFMSGYSVEVAMLIDLLDTVGLDAMAQADVGTRVHRNRPTAELAPMAHAIARTIVARAEEHGRLLSTLDAFVEPLLRDGLRLDARDVAEIEHPPIASLRQVT